MTTLRNLGKRPMVADQDRDREIEDFLVKRGSAERELRRVNRALHVVIECNQARVRAEAGYLERAHISWGDTAALGVLCVYAAEPDAFDTAELQLLKELATDLAFGISALRAREAHRRAEATVARLAYFDSLSGLLLDVQARIGAALFPAHGTDCGSLLLRSNIAAREAKSPGAGYMLYSGATDAENPRQLALTGELRRAIAAEELEGWAAAFGLERPGLARS